MLKNSSEIVKIAQEATQPTYGSSPQPVKPALTSGQPATGNVRVSYQPNNNFIQDIADKLAGFADKTMAPKLFGASTPYEWLTKKIPSMDQTRYEGLRKQFEFLPTYGDIKAYSSAITDPRYHATFFKPGELDTLKRLQWSGAAQHFSGRKYVPGQAAWAYSNNNALIGLQNFSKSPVMSLFLGDYDKLRSAMDLIDSYGQEGSAANKFLQGHITPEQFKSFQRWRPLIAAWMNIRGWLRSLFSGNTFSSMQLSHPRRTNPNITNNIPAPAGI